MAQVNNHSVEQVMHGLFPKWVLDTVLDTMTTTRSFGDAEDGGGLGAKQQSQLTRRF